MSGTGERRGLSAATLQARRPPSCWLLPWWTWTSGPRSGGGRSHRPAYCGLNSSHASAMEPAQFDFLRGRWHIGDTPALPPTCESDNESGLVGSPDDSTTHVLKSPMCAILNNDPPSVHVSSLHFWYRESKSRTTCSAS